MMRYSCSVSGVCEEDISGPYASMDACQSNCIGRSNVDIYQHILSFSPTEALHFAPSDMSAVIRETFGTLINVRGVRKFLTALSVNDYNSLITFASRKSSKVLIKFLKVLFNVTISRNEAGRVLEAIRTNDLGTLVYYPYLYPYLYQHFPTDEYIRALSYIATLASIEELNRIDSPPPQETLTFFFQDGTNDQLITYLTRYHDQLDDYQLPIELIDNREVMTFIVNNYPDILYTNGRDIVLWIINNPQYEYLLDMLLEPNNLRPEIINYAASDGNIDVVNKIRSHLSVYPTLQSAVDGGNREIIDLALQSPTLSINDINSTVYTLVSRDEIDEEILQYIFSRKPDYQITDRNTARRLVGIGLSNFFDRISPTLHPFIIGFFIEINERGTVSTFLNQLQLGGTIRIYLNLDRVYSYLPFYDGTREDFDPLLTFEDSDVATITNLIEEDRPERLVRYLNQFPRSVLEERLLPITLNLDRFTIQDDYDEGYDEDEDEMDADVFDDLIRGTQRDDDDHGWDDRE